MLFPINFAFEVDVLIIGFCSSFFFFLSIILAYDKNIAYKWRDNYLMWPEGAGLPLPLIRELLLVEVSIHDFDLPVSCHALFTLILDGGGWSELIMMIVGEED